MIPGCRSRPKATSNLLHQSSNAIWGKFEKLERKRRTYPSVEATSLTLSSFSNFCRLCNSVNKLEFKGNLLGDHDVADLFLNHARERQLWSINCCIRIARMLPMDMLMTLTTSLLSWNRRGETGTRSNIKTGHRNTHKREQMDRNKARFAVEDAQSTPYVKERITWTTDKITVSGWFEQKMTTNPLKSFFLLEWSTYKTLTKISNLGRNHAYDGFRYINLFTHNPSSVFKLGSEKNNVCSIWNCSSGNDTVRQVIALFMTITFSP